MEKKQATRNEEPPGSKWIMTRTKNEEQKTFADFVDKVMEKMPVLADSHRRCKFFFSSPNDPTAVLHNRGLLKVDRNHETTDSSGPNMDLTFYTEESHLGEPVKMFSSTHRFKDGRLVYSTTQEVVPELSEEMHKFNEWWTSKRPDKLVPVEVRNKRSWLTLPSIKPNEVDHSSRSQRNPLEYYSGQHSVQQKNFTSDKKTPKSDKQVQKVPCKCFRNQKQPPKADEIHQALNKARDLYHSQKCVRELQERLEDISWHPRPMLNTSYESHVSAKGKNSPVETLGDVFDTKKANSPPIFRKELEDSFDVPVASQGRFDTLKSSKNQERFWKIVGKSANSKSCGYCQQCGMTEDDDDGKPSGYLYPEEADADSRQGEGETTPFPIPNDSSTGTSICSMKLDNTKCIPDMKSLSRVNGDGRKDFFCNNKHHREGSSVSYPVTSNVVSQHTKMSLTTNKEYPRRLRKNAEEQKHKNKSMHRHFPCHKDIQWFAECQKRYNDHRDTIIWKEDVVEPCPSPSESESLDDEYEFVKVPVNKKALEDFCKKHWYMVRKSDDSNEKIDSVARQHFRWVIEDCCQQYGSSNK